MAHFMQISEAEINYCLLRKNNRIHSPFRSDNNPSVGFMWDNSAKGYKLRTHDFAQSAYSGDLFDMAARYFTLNIGHRKSFIEVCTYIINNKLNLKGVNRVIELHKSIEFELTACSRRPFKQDIALWESWGINYDMLEVLKIYPIKSYCRSVHGELLKSKWKDCPEDRGYCMDLENGKFKLYFPMRSKSSKYPRFITNSFKPIDYYNPTDIGDKLLVAKSRKEIGFILSYIVKHQLIINGLQVCSLSSESIIPDTHTINSMSSNFRKVFVLQDNDSAGIECTNRFGIIPNAFALTSHIPKSIGKDLTDVYQKNPSEAHRVLKNILTQINTV